MSILFAALIVTVACNDINRSYLAWESLSVLASLYLEKPNMLKQISHQAFNQFTDMVSTHHSSG